MNKDLSYFAAWATLDKLTFLRYQKIKSFYGDLKTAWLNANKSSLIQAGIEGKIAEEIVELKSKIIPDKEKEKLDKENVFLFSYEDKNYPLRLKEIAVPPVFLYVKGDLRPDELALAVVGARQVSAYGKQIGVEIVRDLVLQGITVVSGLALGVDTLAHQEALRVGGRTVAVVGNGIDQVYPFQNKTLAAKIIENGAILSEFPLGTPPHNYNFPRRNRIISGLSLGVLVIEAKDKSGSLITARYAIEQNREIFAVPGSIYNPCSVGTNQLIQKGEAKLVQKAQDILEELNISKIQSQDIIKTVLSDQNSSPLEQKICEMLSKEPLAFDVLQSTLSIDTAQISSALTLLEMKGYAMNLGNNQWVKSV